MNRTLHSLQDGITKAGLSRFIWAIVIFYVLYIYTHGWAFLAGIGVGLVVALIGARAAVSRQICPALRGYP